MKRSLMVAAALAAFVVPAAAPLSVLAQEATSTEDRADIRERRREARERRSAAPTPPPPRVERPDRQERREDRQERRQERRAERPNHPAPPEIRRERREDRRENRQERREDRRENRQERREDRPNRPENREERRENRQDRREDRHENRQERREDRREHRQDRREDRQERRQDRREYREFRQRFNAARWRQDWNRRHGHGWWRNDRRWRGYSGIRFGFYFAPGYGYYNVPRQYWHQRWSVGEYLPSIFWRYQLDDWRTYGLGYPPEGTRWVLVDNHIYLIDQYDGYIIDVIYDAWRW